jgi:hypothetical protein
MPCYAKNNWMLMAKFFYVQFSHKINKYAQSDKMQKEKWNLWEILWYESCPMTPLILSPFVNNDPI